MNEGNAAEARKGLLDSVVGKAKEIAGAVTGKDELAEEGQLQQADAQARKDANSRAAIADATAEKAAAELRERAQNATEITRTAYADAGREEQATRQAEVVEKSVADSQAVQQERDARRQAEEHAKSIARHSGTESVQLEAQAAKTARDAELEHDRLVTEAAETERRARQLRTESQSK